MKQIPNLFTLLNLVFGCLAITVILQNGITIQYGTDGAQLVDIPEKIWMAPLFIAIAAVIDFLDGFIARLFNAQSEMGKQLDSLADVVSFGVAPSFILYQFLRMSFAKEVSGVDVSIIWLVPAFLVAAAGAYRLARFNIDHSQQYGFKGVPIPAVGLLIASLPLIYWNTDNVTLVNILLNKWFLYALILIVSWLMVSRLPLMALKFKNLSLKDNLAKFIFILFSIIAVFIFHWLSVPVIFIAYIILSLAFKNQLK
ncbi:MAG: CDP-alcohol phosphatidyltransferase family protein [Bacteroidetes bacterium]|nr:CDP-alcohol phosphatidyltransferase family protein [Bacteroidota bacterium]MBS1756975.1 CDP-alcohol phosphatidyltransferase family protein [Bacteroidota bacterium]